jgi:hypothetical protein
MMLEQHPSPSWAAVPNLREVSLSESLRLLLIVGSLSFVILAGQLANSRRQGRSDSAVAAVASQDVRVSYVQPQLDRSAQDGQDFKVNRTGQ